jgi:thiamine pyrophosphate-dependent acetolactate synthase large subunit-like protein
MLMSQRQALEVLVMQRANRIVITTMSSTGIWPELSDTPLDFGYNPSSMGEGPPLGLGLALAQPKRGVIVVNGDGCMLMNLGTLVTIGSNPANLFVVLLDNGIYEITGGQPTAGSGRVDYASLAKASGIQRVYSFDTYTDWRSNAAKALSGTGPVFIWLKVEARFGQKAPKVPHQMMDQIQRLRQALQVKT